MRIIHDTAFAMTKALTEVVAPCIREEEQAELFRLFLEICKAGIQGYEIQVNRAGLRLRPTKN
jgi:hypothetical protein